MPNYSTWWLEASSKVAREAHAHMMKDAGRNPVLLAYKPNACALMFVPTWVNGAAASTPDGFVAVENGVFPTGMTVQQTEVWVRYKLERCPLYPGDDG